MTKNSRTLNNIIALTSILVLILLGPRCKQTSSADRIDDVDVFAVVLFKVGNVELNHKQIQVGDLVRGGFEIKVGAQSVCDLQIKEPNMVVTLRIQADTVVTLSARERGLKRVLRPLVRVGRLMLRTGKLKPGQEVEVISRSAMASVRGTDFEMSVAKEGGGAVTVVSGRVAVRPRIPGLEDLPAVVIGKSASLRKVLAALNKQETVLETGAYLPVDRNYSNRILKAVPGLKKLLDNPALQAVAGKSKVDPAALKAAADALEAGLKGENLVRKVTAAAEKDAGENPPKPAILKDPELKKKLREYENLISMEQEKLRSAKDYKKAVAEFNKKRRPALLKRIGEIMDKDPITLVLKDGQKISGVALPVKDGEPYLVLTPDGTRRISRDRVDHIAY